MNLNGHFINWPSTVTTYRFQSFIYVAMWNYFSTYSFLKPTILIIWLPVLHLRIRIIIYAFLLLLVCNIVLAFNMSITSSHTTCVLETFIRMIVTCRYIYRAAWWCSDKLKSLQLVHVFSWWAHCLIHIKCTDIFSLLSYSSNFLRLQCLFHSIQPL